MRNNSQDLQDQVELTAIKAFAATTKTPFMTAFKATLGVAAAQLLISVVVFGSLAAAGTLIYFILR